MKLLQISYTNEKGQIVIPKKMREELAIDENVPLKLESKNGSIYISPMIDWGHHRPNDKERFLSILEKTQGAWADFDRVAWKKQKEHESQLTAARKKAW